MKLNKSSNAFNITKYSCILLVVTITLLLMSNRSFSANKCNISTLTFVNNEIEKTLRKPLDRVENLIELMSLNYKDTLSKEIQAQESRRDFKWVFKPDGLSPTSPVVNQTDGTIYVPTSDIDISLDLRNLSEDITESISIGELQNKLYALKPIAFGNRRRAKWILDTDGIALFPPTVTNDNKIFIETIDGTFNLEDFDFENIDIGNIDGNFVSKITAVDDEGNNLWNAPFENSVFINPPIVTPDLVLTSRLNIGDLSSIAIDKVSVIITAIDSLTGNTVWSFNPDDLDGDSRFFVIAPPVVSNNKVFVNAINAISQEEISDLIKENIENVQDDATTIINDALLSVLEAISLEEDTEAILNDMEGDLEPIIDDILNNVLSKLFNMSKIFALNLESGEMLWESRFPGISLTSPIIPDLGRVNVNSLDILFDDVESDINIGIDLTQDGILKADASLNLSAAGVSIDLGIEFTIDVISDDPSSTIETNISEPDFEGILDDLSIALGGVSTTLDESSGDQLWTTPINEAIFLKPVVSEDGSQIIIGASGLNINNGSDDREISNSTIKVYSLDTINGNINWESEQINGTIASPLLLGPDSSVVFPFTDLEGLKVAALNAENGITKWPTPFEPDGIITLPPVIDQNNGKVLLLVNKSDITNIIDDIDDTFDPDNSDSEGRRRGSDLGPDLNGEIVSLNPSNGSIDKSIAVDGLSIAAPAIDEERNTIYATTMDFKIGRNPISLDFSSLVHAARLQ